MGMEAGCGREATVGTVAAAEAAAAAAAAAAWAAACEAAVAAWFAYLGILALLSSCKIEFRYLVILHCTFDLTGFEIVEAKNLSKH